MERNVVRSLCGAAVIMAAACGGGTGTAKAPSSSPVRASTTTEHTAALPYVASASQAACATDAQTIESAEDQYLLLNGHFASMAQLVGQQFLQSASVYYPTVELGSPTGGYTLVADTGRCENLRLPVRGS